ncbi:FAD-binding oxidoreductase [Asticcacaulis sp. AND118]|uniref:FAD-binding oxidoreductase n=1 Tax=Asticcacaulis sp. AND118 TaxID=2840468 RepID=UPI001CFFF1ED|nr:FAD-binding oxidoreductase [Asticcacaulis sp. AND118]UDF05188.1 FAD-binding oxidoreductase [Asticcacaulis sp. AND118]
MPLLRSIYKTAIVGAAAFAAILMPAHSRAAETVNDITQLNPIQVERVVAPVSASEIATRVRDHQGPVSIGGGRYSQGGQTACTGCLFIDMRQMNRVLDFSPAKKQITVEAGITWRAVQEVVDRENLSLRIMQSFSNFTVGGSLSVNAHGRYVGEGPIVHSVESLRLVLADGSLKNASRQENPDLFFGAIGGYGGIGVITDVTLNLTENVRIERTSKRMKVKDYKAFFETTVKPSEDAVFHNATLFSPEYKNVSVLTFSHTDKPLDITDRLSPRNPADSRRRMLIEWATRWPFGKQIKEHVYDPLVNGPSRVAWRNYDASQDVASIEPASRTQSTYALQEYFIPEAHFDAFVPRLREILRRYKVNVLNVSIRHARADTDTLLSWARSDVFSFVLYYEQGVDSADREAVGVWTRELIDAAIGEDGSYYLPYQIHATPEQFRAAYPRAEDFFALKRRVDPTYKFRNRLWEAYYTP